LTRVREVAFEKLQRKERRKLNTNDVLQPLKKGKGSISKIRRKNAGLKKRTEKERNDERWGHSPQRGRRQWSRKKIRLKRGVTIFRELYTPGTQGGGERVKKRRLPRKWNGILKPGEVTEGKKGKKKSGQVARSAAKNFSEEKGGSVRVAEACKQRWGSRGRKKDLWKPAARKKN